MNRSSVDARYMVGQVQESPVERLQEYDRLNRLKKKAAEERAREFEREHGIEPSTYDVYMETLREIPSKIGDFWRNGNFPICF